MNLASALRQARARQLAVQAFGPLCGFVTVLAIARLGGAAAQGEFAQTKAWVELLVAIGCFGFPQSIVYVINRLGASARTLGLISIAYSLAFVPVGWALTHLALRLGWTHVKGADAALFLLVLAAALFVLHGLWRGVYLTSKRETGFALFSIFPPVTLLASVLGSMAWGHQGEFPALFVLSAALSAGLALALMQPLLRAVPGRASALDAVPWQALCANGLHSFIQALLLVLQPLLAYALIRGQGGSDQAIGLFNVGVFLVQGLSVPISMLSPLLFAHWTATDDAARIVRLHALTRRGLVLDAVLGGAAAAASFVVVPLLFGPAYVRAETLVAVMMLCLPLTCHGRLIAPALHAHDRPAVNSVAGVLRLGGLGLGGWGLGTFFIIDPLLAVAMAWGMSEVLASTWVLWVLRRLAHEFARDAQAPGEAAR